MSLRTLQRRARTFIAALIIGLALVSCAQPSNDPIETERLSLTIGSPSSSLQAPKSKIALGFPEGLVVSGASSEATLVIYDRQFDEYASKKALAASPLGAKLTINASALQKGKKIGISFPYTEAYDALGTAIFIQAKGSFPLGLDESVTNGVMTAYVDSDFLLFLADEAGTSTVELDLLFVRDRPGYTEPDTAYLSSIQLWKGNAFTEAVPDLKGKKVAMVVHGVFSSLADMTTLAAALAAAKDDLGALKYDYVIGFEYGMGASIPTQGSDMALKYRALTGATEVARLDIFAHSMGNLVSRWAMQRPDMADSSGFAASRIGQYVTRYVSLGGPHAGVPFRPMIDYFMGSMSFILDISLKLTVPCLSDLICYGTPKGAEVDVGYWAPSATIGKLNYTSHSAVKGPDFDTLKIVSIAGNKMGDYAMMGTKLIPKLFYYMYWANLWKNPYEDGIVAAYSARSPELAKIANTVEYVPTWPMNHAEIYNAPMALTDIKALIAAKGW